MTARPARATEAEIQRVVLAWTKLGLQVGGVEVTAEGTVRVLAPLAEAAKPVPIQGLRSWDE